MSTVQIVVRSGAPFKNAGLPSPPLYDLGFMIKILKSYVLLDH